jgi:tetratricopeptide (TPR) repeat protein/transcriptional regulator with XRE-family HTH domain
METGPSPSFATLLRRYRVAAGLTQEELAERARLSARTLGDLERGVSHAPRKDTVALLAQALDLGAPERAALAQAARRLSPASSRPTPAGTSSPPLVGRAHELALLERHLRGQGPPVLLLAGEPGIGKTRLLHAALPRAAGQGLRVLEGGCQRRGGHAPYAPLLEALQRHIRHQAPAQQRTELAGCVWLVRLLPELADGPIEPVPAWTLPPEQEWRLMVQAVLRFLGNVAGPAGTLLVLDDLQWASPDALDLLTVLARSAAEVPLRVLGAYRDTELGPRDPLAMMLADLAQAELATQHTLGPLGPEEAGQLLAALLDDGAGAEFLLQQRVLQRSGGVPFFLVSCAQALRTTEGEDRRAERVPWDVAQGLRQRVAALPAAAQEVLGVAAVVGRVVAPALLTVVTAQGEEDVLAACEAACRARLLQEAGAEGYRFPHDVIREVVEADLGAARRTMLHRRVAEALDQGWEGLSGRTDRPIELLAYHYACGGVQDAAIRYLEQAGDQAWAQHANAAAAGYYQELVDRLEALGRRADSSSAREKLGVVLTAMGRYDAALATLERAVETCRAVGDGEGLERVAAQIGRVYAVRDTPAEGIGYLRSLLASLEASEASHGVAALHVALARLLHVVRSDEHERDEELAVATRSVELARRVGDTRILGEALWLRGAALGHVGRVEEALGVLEEAQQVAEGVGDLDSLVHALREAAFLLQHLGEFDKSGLYSARALAVAERRGDPWQIAHATGSRAVNALVIGNWDQALADFERGLAIRREIGLPALYALAFLGSLSLLRGKQDEAARYLDEALASAEQSHDGGVLRFVHGLLAERDVLEGRAKDAYERLAPLLKTPELANDAFLLKQLAWVCVELGDLDQAEDVVERALTRVQAANDRIGLVELLRVQALLLIKQGRWAQAHCTLEEGLTLTRRMPYPHIEGRLLHVYGLLHVAQGEPGPAQERLEGALAIFRRLGARKDAEQVEQAIADLQQPVLERDRTPPGLYSQARRVDDGHAAGPGRRRRMRQQRDPLP